MTSVHRRERLGAAGSRAGDRQALEHGGGRQPQRLRQVPDGAGHGEGRRRGVGGIGAEMAVGMAMAQQMMNQTGGIDGAVDAGHRRTPPPRRRRRGARAADAGAGRADARRRRIRRAWRASKPGDLKGKKIGTQWRVTRAAVDAFLSVMNAPDPTRRARCCALAALSRWSPYRASRRRIRTQREAQKARASGSRWPTSVDAAASCEAAGGKFQERDRSRAMGRRSRSAREPLGALVQRTIIATAFDDRRFPDGARQATTR